jgi:VIT1/CCC1 family predicted Fe2+/Mn2+ transporter
MNSLKKFLPEITYGGVDGLITTFAIISASIGADLSKSVIVIMALANVVADGFSMGVSSFLSEKTKKIHRIDPHLVGLSTFSAFVFIGSIPVLPFLFLEKRIAYKFSVILYAILLFVIGSLKNGDNIIFNGMETLTIGSIAAFISYYIAYFIDRLY